MTFGAEAEQYIGAEFYDERTFTFGAIAIIASQTNKGTNELSRSQYLLAAVIN